jgi:MFS family permease
MVAQPRTAGEEWKAHWPMVLASMVGFSFYSMVTYSLGTFMEPLQKAFGWSRAEISLGLTIFGLTAAICGPGMGALLDRFGSRRMAFVGLIISAAGFACFGLSTGSITQWIVIWLIFSFFSVMIKSTVWSAGASSVFTAGRGLALAAVLSGSALAQIFAPLIANWLIQNHGWRLAYIWIGLGWGGVGAVMVLLFLRDAHALRKRLPATGEPVRLPGLTIREASRDQRVIRIGIANLLMAFVGAGITVHLVPLIAETGIPKGQAVGIAATAGIAGIVGKFLAGWLLDRLQGNIVPFTSFAIGAIGYFLLLHSFGTRAELFAGTMCIGYAAGAGLQVSTYLISRYAGLRNFGVIFGSIASLMMAGTSFGPLFAGRVHDLTGSYSAALWTAIPIMLTCSFLFVGLGPYPVFAAAEASEETLLEVQLAQ